MSIFYSNENPCPRCARLVKMTPGEMVLGHRMVQERVTFVAACATSWGTRILEAEDALAKIAKWIEPLRDVSCGCGNLVGPCKHQRIWRVIGNGSWTETCCRQCGDCDIAVAVVGQPMDYESATTELCGPCLRAALELLGGHFKEMT